MNSITLTLLSLMVLTACGSPLPTQTHPPSQSATAQNQGQQIGFELETLEGKKVRLADFKGKAVLIQFFSTICPACQKDARDYEAKIIQNLDRSEKMAVIGIAVHHGRDDVKKWLENTGVTYPVLLDPQGDVFKLYRSKAVLPTWVFLAPNLEIREVQTTWGSTEAWIKKLEELSRSK